MVFLSVIRSVKIIWQLEHLDKVVREVTIYDTGPGEPNTATSWKDAASLSLELLG